MCHILPPATVTYNYHLPPNTYHLPSAIYHLLPSIYHLPPTTYHLPPTTYHLPSTTYQLAPTTYHLPPTTYHLPPTTYQPTTYHQTPGSCFLKTLGPPSKCEILVLPPAPCLLPAVSFTACHLPSAFNEGRGGEIPTRKTGVAKHSSARPRIYTFPTNHFIKF